MTGMNMLSDMFAQSNQNNRFFGVTVGIVTNNKDEEGLGRVKVKFPWLSDTDESNWARVLSPMAGKECGVYFLPEVGDEVLVAFEQGDIEYPYILGGLWNGKDKPPDSNNDGKNNQRIIKSRSGHIIRLDDTEGEEKIEVIDQSGKNSIMINTKNNAITITADADITIQSKNGKLKLSGKGIEINSQAEIKIAASQDMKLKGTMVDIN